jgi:hypothetical protein
MAIKSIRTFNKVIGRGRVTPSHNDLRGWLKSIAGKAKIK